MIRRKGASKCTNRRIVARRARNIREHASWCLDAAGLLDSADPRLPELLGAAANSFQSASQHDRAIELGERSIALAKDLGVAPPALGYAALGQALSFRGEAARAIDVLGEGVSAFPPDPTDVRVILLYLYAALDLDQAENGERDLLGTAVRMAEESGSESHLAYAMLTRAGAAHDDDPGAAIADYQRVYELAPKTNSALTWGHFGHARAAHKAGLTVEALEHYEQAIRTALDGDILMPLSVGTAALAQLAAALGVQDGIADLYRTAVAIEQRSGRVILNYWGDDIDHIGRLIRELGIDTESGGVLTDRELRQTVRRVTVAALELAESDVDHQTS